MLIPEELLQAIVDQTNLYHHQSRDLEIPVSNDVSMPEIKAFLGIVLAMGIVDLPKFYDYWSCNDPITAVPWFANIMPRDRFFISSDINTCQTEQKNQPKMTQHSSFTKLAVCGS